uniref:F5/8 type C domain-containing protein n=1 Tax=Alexandrium catenella TaxID=2925 RepID=A0A7S1WL95_ALECA|mmetsp:Transcript_70660/g.187804  ORF Transcript_70660/g.187804 Transcript_70660/m.187804 type:complete len:952 (+) Transcript_70660:96-2951(+)
MKVPLLAAAAMYGVTGFLFQAETDKLNDPDPGECSSSGNVKMISWSKAKLPGGLDGRRMQNISKYFNPSGKSLYMQVPPPPGLPEEVYKQAIVKPKKKSLSAHSIAHSILEHKRRKQKEEEDMRQRVTEIQTQAREKAVAEELAHRRAQSRNDDDDDDDDNDPKMANIPKSVEQHQFLPLILPSWLWRYTTGTGAFTNVPMGWKTMSKFDLLKSENPFQIEMVLDDDEETLGGGRSIVIDLGAPHKINVIKIDWAVCACRRLGAVQLQVSNDGIRWKAVQKPLVGAWGSHNVRYYEVENVFTYFRIMPTVASPVQWVGVWDIQMFGETALRFPNAYGWYHSYQSGDRFYGGTEINFLIPMGNVLYACFGNWMNTRTWRPAEVLRLDCPFCDWNIEYATDFAGRIECLKAMTWPAASSWTLTKDMDKLYISYYINWVGQGRTILGVQGAYSPYSWFSGNLGWQTAPYFKRFPYNEEWFSARCMSMFRDPLLGVDFMFISTGVWGIQRGSFCSYCSTYVYFSDTGKAESDWLPTRPLGLTVLDERIYTSTLSWIKKRVNGLFPYWYIVFEMAHVDSSEVETAPGGIRGLTTIPNPSTPGGLSLYYLWVANAGSAGCMYRLDPCAGETCANTTISPDFNYETEDCVRNLYSDYLGTTREGRPAHVSYIAANYNFPTPFTKTNGDTAHIIGFEALLFGLATRDFPIDHRQHDVSPTGFRLGYHAAGGFVIRHGKSSYEVREPWGRRMDPSKYLPTTTAIRTIAVSPFGDGAFYMGGYDPNHFPVADTAWVMRGEASAVWEEDVPCLPQEGCPHRPGDVWTMKGCKWCRSWRLKPASTAFWFGDEGSANVMRCQGVLKYLNTKEGSDYCEEAKDWDVASKCCEHVGCDICKAMPDKVFNPYALAGTNEDGVEYSCKEAMEFRIDSDMDCTVATDTWKEWCCRKNEGERGDGTVQKQ